MSTKHPISWRRTGKHNDVAVPDLSGRLALVTGASDGIGRKSVV